MSLIDWIIVILLIAWLTGNFALPAAGGLLNVLLVVAILVILYRLITGKNP